MEELDGGNTSFVTVLHQSLLPYSEEKLEMFVVYFRSYQGFTIDIVGVKESKGLLSPLLQCCTSLGARQKYPFLTSTQTLKIKRKAPY
jgi:hypothetical protein